MLGKTMLVEATRVQENAHIPPEKLALPKDAKIIEAANPLETLRHRKTPKKNEKTP
jgi:hypothetical protein